MFNIQIYARIPQATYLPKVHTHNPISGCHCLAVSFEAQPQICGACNSWLSVCVFFDSVYQNAPRAAASLIVRLLLHRLSAAQRYHATATTTTTTTTATATTNMRMVKRGEQVQYAAAKAEDCCWSLWTPIGRRGVDGMLIVRECLCWGSHSASVVSFAMGNQSAFQGPHIQSTARGGAWNMFITEKL